MKTLLAAGRLRNKSERRGEAIAVRLYLKGDAARRFEALRGSQCPREFAAELLSNGLEKIERANPEKAKAAVGFRQ